MASASSCVACRRTVRKRQEGLQCDNCDRWQHRVCGTDITRSFYRQLVRGDAELPYWQCTSCNDASILNNAVCDDSSECVQPTTPDRTRSSLANTFFDYQMPTRPLADVNMSLLEHDTPYASFFDYPTPNRSDTVYENDSDTKCPKPGSVSDQVVTNITKDTKKRLFEPRGYSYTSHYRVGESTHWKCCAKKCGATLRQEGDVVIPGSKMHTHSPDNIV